MGINTQASRIKLHTVTSAGAFTVPASEDFTDGSWTIYDLAKSEIGVNENSGKAFIRIGASVKELQTDASENIGTNNLTITDTTRTLTLAGSTDSERFIIEKGNGQDLVQFRGGGIIGLVNATTIDQIGTGEYTWQLGGNLSTDKFVIKRGDALQTHFMVSGSGSAQMGYIGSANPYMYVDPSGSTRARFQKDNSNYMDFPSSSSGTARITVDSYFDFGFQSTRYLRFIESGVGTYYFANGGLQFVTTNQSHGGTNMIAMQNGTAPTTDRTDKMVFYSADESAGNACFHTRTESGQIIKLYQETTGVSAATFTANTSGISDDSATWGGYTVGQVVQALQNLGILQ